MVGPEDLWFWNRACSCSHSNDRCGSRFRALLIGPHERLMLKRLLSLLGIGLAAGCANNGTQQGESWPQSDQLSGVGVQLGGSDPDEPRCLPFKILKVYEGRSPSTNTPYHVEGGEWTYFTCQTSSDPAAAFTVGLLTKRDASGGLPVWRKAFLVVSDRHEGEKFIESFNGRFAGTWPTPIERDFSPAPFHMTTTVLGENLNREEIAFSGRGGGWTATKWFPTHDGREAEVYFNFNVEAKEGDHMLSVTHEPNGIHERRYGPFGEQVPCEREKLATDIVRLRFPLVERSKPLVRETSQSQQAANKRVTRRAAVFWDHEPGEQKFASTADVQQQAEKRPSRSVA
jgi:hypothetical protein